MGSSHVCLYLIKSPFSRFILPCIYTSPPHEQNESKGQFLSGVKQNSEFSFSKIGLLTTGGIIVGFIFHLFLILTTVSTLFGRILEQEKEDNPTHKFKNVS